MFFFLSGVKPRNLYLKTGDSKFRHKKKALDSLLEEKKVNFLPWK